MAKKFKEKVNIDYSLSQISRFEESVEEALANLEAMNREIRGAHEKAADYLKGNLKNVEQYLEHNRAEESKTQELIALCEKRISEAEERKSELQANAAKLEEQLGPLYDAYKNAAAQETNIHNSPPKKSGEGPEADQAYKQAVRAWHQRLDNASKLVRSSWEDYSRVKHAAEECRKKIGEIEHFIQELNQCLWDLNQILGRVRSEQDYLLRQQSDYQRADNELEKRYSNFQMNYSSADSAFQMVLNRTHKANQYASKVNLTLSDLGQSPVMQDNIVQFSSILEVHRNACLIEDAASSLEASLGEVKRMAFVFSEQISDGIMNAAVEKLDEITMEQRGVVTDWKRAADELNRLACELQNYHDTHLSLLERWF